MFSGNTPSTGMSTAGKWRGSTGTTPTNFSENARPVSIGGAKWMPSPSQSGHHSLVMSGSPLIARAASSFGLAGSGRCACPASASRSPPTFSNASTVTKRRFGGAMLAKCRSAGLKNVKACTKMSTGLADSREGNVLMTATEAASHLRVSKRTLYNLDLPRVKLGRAVRWRRGDLDALAEQCLQFPARRGVLNERGIQKRPRLLDLSGLSFREEVQRLRLRNEDRGKRSREKVPGRTQGPAQDPAI